MAVGGEAEGGVRKRGDGGGELTECERMNREEEEEEERRRRG